MLTATRPVSAAAAVVHRNAVFAGYTAAWIVCVGLAAITARVLYADGAYFLLSNLVAPHRFRDYDPQRSFASFITQSPILLGQRMGSDSVAGYAALYSLGIYALPAAAFLFAMYLSRSQPGLFALNAISIVVFGFGVNFINTEVNLFFGLIFLSATILALNGRHPTLRAIVLPVLAFALLRVYEGMLLAGPFLAAMTIIAVRKTDDTLERAGLLIAGLLFLLGTAIGLQGFLAPRDPSNAASFASSALAYMRNPQFHLLLCAIAVLPAVFAQRRTVRLVAVAIAIIFGAMFLRSLLKLEGYYAYGIYYYNRSFLVLATPLALALIAWSPLARISTDAPTRAIAIGWLLVPFAFAVAGDLVGTKRWNDYLAGFCLALQANGPVERSPDVLVQGGYLTGWPWTHPTMSVLLRDRGSRVVVRNEAFQKWEPEEIRSLPALQYQGVCRQPLWTAGTSDVFTTPINFTGSRYPDYVSSIRGLSTSEGWATWSDGSTIVFMFSRDLPSSFDVALKVAAVFHDNRGQPFTVRAGRAQQTFVVNTEPSEVTLRFRDVGKAKTITIDVPRAESPSARGSNPSDTRKLGIALVSLEIVPQGELPEGNTSR